MKQKFSALLFSLFLSCGIYAQGEASHWFFGVRAGLNFKITQTLNGVANVPTFESGPVNTSEGCFSLSSRQGAFLFASDGIEVYNRNKVRMPNGAGLYGDPSSAQSGIVIPRPKHPNNFYIVTVSARLGPYHGLNYSEVDMTLDSGKGDIINKNKPLDYGGAKIGSVTIDRTDSYECITGVGHQNGTDYWLVHRSRDKFFAWLVTENGIGPSPTAVSEIGDDLGSGKTNTNPTIGYLKLSPDGKYVAHAGFTSRKMTVGEFDNATGKVSNIRVVNTNTPGPYGVEFSPSGEYLYWGTLNFGYAENSETRHRVYCAPIADLLIGSITNIRNIGCGISVQLAPDKRIYALLSESRHLYMIEDPDAGGTSFKKFTNFFPSGNMTQRGLPTFTSSFLNLSDIITNPELPVCYGTEVEFSTQIYGGTGVLITGIEWDFGDGSPVVEEPDLTQYIFTQKHIYSKPGNYVLTLTVHKSDNSIVTSKEEKIDVRISRCIMPVNHNISVMGY